MNTHTMKDNYGTWSITVLPGSDTVGWSHDVEIFEGHRRKGHGQRQHKQRLAFAKTLGLNTLLCSVVDYNTEQIHILEKMGWARLKNTDYNCETIWGIKLDDLKMHS